ncbi:transcription factor [Pseudomassariella vexata]|uniref:Transcription initiation factor IIB n=1 Tax=Pseudomassariella vexata TaxID=1141098 RepID=A0A1Y2DBI2_9PEZI|nr:transcription factor [Pseudomassariella vexata]ORY56618.1 transcription factor [Pseudomassariella vexata]
MSGGSHGVPGAAGAAGAAKEVYKENLNEVLMCPDCRVTPPTIVEEFSSGDMVCGDCGLVLGDRIIDTRSEWRTFANDDQGNDDPSRVGDSMNPLLNGSQLETTIGFGEGSRARELQRAQNRTQNDKATKTLLSAYREITTLCDAMQINKDAQDRAKHIFKLTDDAKLFKSKPQESVIAACIFIACRQANQSRTFKEIFQLTRVPKKEIGRTFKQLEKFLQTIQERNTAGLSLQPMDNGTGSTSAGELCGRFSAQLGFTNPHRMEKISKTLAEKSSSIKDLAGRSPLSVAAACIYMASHLIGEPKNTKEIALVAGVSDGTIKTAYRFLLAERNALIEQAWLTGKIAGDMSRLPNN